MTLYWNNLYRHTRHWKFDKRCTVNPLYIDTRYNDQFRYNDNFNVTKSSLKWGNSQWEIMQEYCIKTSSNICFGYLLESPHWGDSNKYPKHIFYEEMRIKYVLWGNENKTRFFLHNILSIKDYLQQHIHFNGNIFWNKFYRCIEGSLYVYTKTQKEIYPDSKKIC